MVYYSYVADNFEKSLQPHSVFGTATAINCVGFYFMAKDKKSFILYCDQQGLFNQLPDDIAGKLIKHIFAYVNDENPVTNDLLINIAFEPIKLQLKRDLRKYDEYIDKQRLNGAKGGRPKKPNETQETQPFFEEPKKADNVNDNDTDNDNEIKNKGAKRILPPTMNECVEWFIQNKFNQKEAAAFFHYWESMNWTRKNGAKIQKWKSAASQWISKLEPQVNQQPQIQPKIATL